MLTKNNVKFGLRTIITGAAAAGAILAPKIIDRQVLDVILKATGVALASASVDGAFAACDLVKNTDVKVTKTDEGETIIVEHTHVPKADVDVKPIEKSEPKTKH